MCSCIRSPRGLEGTVANTCSSLRALLRFLHATDGWRANPALSIGSAISVYPSGPAHVSVGSRQAHPTVAPSPEPPGKRDFSILLLLAMET